MGTTKGGRKANQTLKVKLGLKGYREHMAAIGAKGGGAKVAKGFSMTRGKMASELHKARQQPSERQEQDENAGN